MIGDESGVILKDNSGGGGSGATWAFEVAGQTMVCPIIVEDLNPPGQMLIEVIICFTLPLNSYAHYLQTLIASHCIADAL